MQAGPVFEPALQGSEDSVLAIFRDCLAGLTHAVEHLRLDLVPACTSVHQDAEVASLIEWDFGFMRAFPLFCFSDALPILGATLQNQAVDTALGSGS